MEALIYLIGFIWAIRIFLNTLSYAQLWWVKEYRWDRMRIHLATPQGRRFWWPPCRRPPIIPKSTALVLLCFIVIGWIVWVLPWHILLRMFAADALSFPVTWLLVLILNAPVLVYHRMLIARAVMRLREHKPMMVIGITGSYGKTSTKDYLATILSSKYKTLKTEASKNSPIGIAEVILKNLRPDHEMFVVEMGAYKIGEIAAMARMVRPQIGIITAINPQHQDLFGTLENTMKAKYELIAGLTGKRIAIMNADDERVRAMAQWAKRDGCDVWEGKLTATDTRADFNGLSFVCHFGKENAQVTARVVGAHQVTNILLAMSAALAAGMTFEEAARAVGNIRAAPKVLELVGGINRATCINDTFNNNPNAARAALDVLAWGKGKKYLVFQPMIELGSFASRSHEEVGAYAAKVCDEIILTNKNFYEDFVRGVRKTSEATNISVLSPEKAAELLARKLHMGDAVLFKGKEAEHILKKCKK